MMVPFVHLVVPRPFVHLGLEMMVLLSMGSDWIFVRIKLNAYSNSLRRTFVQSSAPHYFSSSL